jgi:hypothetical protein
LQGQKESKRIVNSELKKLQFLGAGPKMAVPDVDAFSKLSTKLADDYNCCVIQ